MKRLALVSLIFVPLSFGQAPDPEALYKANCAMCHDATGAGRAPSRAGLQQTSPEIIVDALEAGIMKQQGAKLSAAERISLAEFLTAKKLGTQTQMSGRCEGNPPALRTDGPAWNGWGASEANLRYQPDPGFSAEQVGNLKLKWAFGLPNTGVAYGQASVVAGRVFVASANRHVYSLDAHTGCYYWDYEATSGIRTAPTVAALAGEPKRYAVFFGDARARAYAVDAETGKLIWKTVVDEGPYERITGAPTHYKGRLYVPLSSTEDGQTLNPKYACCISRGGVAALDAATGRLLWKTYSVDEPTLRGKNSVGAEAWGPSGAPIWSSPTVDAERGVVYAGTGDNHSAPLTTTSDAMLAFSLDTGKIVWSRQLTSGDTFNIACVGMDKTNCPRLDAPDVDIGSSANLVKLSNGKSILVVGQKSGVVWGLDPDHRGAVLWKVEAGKGGKLGGIQWGAASDGKNVYAAISDLAFVEELIRPGKPLSPNPEKGGGLVAIQVATGETMWKAAPQPCSTRKGCSPAQSAAVSVIPGVVFSGSVDGHLRGYSTKDGKIIWDYDTARDFETVNGVKANGGSLDAAGPTIAGGMLFVSSGYGAWGGYPGNVLLAFEVK
jgi:polyvinyl alcohol dehydrogenase (cytochrome)